MLLASVAGVKLTREEVDQQIEKSNQDGITNGTADKRSRYASAAFSCPKSECVWPMGG